MNQIIEMLLNEVDPDIRKIMLTPYNIGKSPNTYFIWELLPDPINAILNWQALRDRRK